MHIPDNRLGRLGSLSVYGIYCPLNDAITLEQHLIRHSTTAGYSIVWAFGLKFRMVEGSRSVGRQNSAFSYERTLNHSMHEPASEIGIEVGAYDSQEYWNEECLFRHTCCLSVV